MCECKFEAVIKSSEIGAGGAYIEFPFNVEEVFGTKGRVTVVCFFEDVEYRGSLVKMGTNCHIIGITKDIRKEIGKEIGDKIKIRLCKDNDERIIEIHPLLIDELKKNQILMANYEKLSYTRKKEIAQQLESAKKEETLKSRLDKFISKLLNS